MNLYETLNALADTGAITIPDRPTLDDEISQLDVSAFEQIPFLPDPAISRQTLIAEARGLLEPGEEHLNPEYLRALVELVNRASGGVADDYEMVERWITERYADHG